MPAHEIHERAAGVTVPDILLASQYFDRIRRRSDLTGEQRLMFAIIKDAVHVYTQHAAARDRQHQALFVDADRWVEADDHSWLFSFVTICEYLGFDADHVRRGLRAWKMRARGEVPAAATAASTETPERRRASNE